MVIDHHHLFVELCITTLHSMLKKKLLKELMHYGAGIPEPVTDGDAIRFLISVEYG